MQKDALLTNHQVHADGSYQRVDVTGLSGKYLMGLASLVVDVEVSRQTAKYG